MSKKNPAAVALGRLGGQAVTEAKKKANAERIKQYWDRVRAGELPPRRPRKTMKTNETKTIEGRKVTRNPEHPKLWDARGVGAQSGKVVFTGALTEIRKALKK